MDTVIHVKVPEKWYEGLRALAVESEGTINQQARLAIRERLEREGRIDGARDDSTAPKEKEA